MKKQDVINILCIIGMIICFALAGRIDTWFLAMGVIK